MGAVELSRAAVVGLRTAVQRRQVTYAELGRLTGTSASTVSGFMNHRQPNWAINTFCRLAAALRLDVGIVLIPRGEPYRWCGDPTCPGRHTILLAGDSVGVVACHGAPVRT